MLRLSTVDPASPSGPLSRRVPPVVSLSRPESTSIQDFKIIKPLNRGAFGSVFFDHHAMKVLKMAAKNQLAKVKMERMILTNQAESGRITLRC